MANAIRYKNTKIPRHHDEQARLKVIQGADYGAVYIVTGQQATIGRGEENDVVIFDLKASRLHAQIKQKENRWTLRDLGSANGLVVNGKKTRSSSIKTGDVIELGESSFEFLASGEVGTSFLTAPVRTMEEVRHQRQQYEQQRKQVHSSARLGKLAQLFRSSQAGAAAGSSEKRRKMIIYGVLAIGVWVLMSDSGNQSPSNQNPKNQKQDKKEKKGERELSSFLPGEESSQVKDTAKVFFKKGFRDYRERNYMRAKKAFKTALQISPNYREAKQYLEKSKQSIEEEVDYHLENGKRALDAGKLRQAEKHFEFVIRFLDDQTDKSSYQEAKDHLKTIQEKLKGTLS